MATLDDVVKAVKEGNEGTATQQAKEAEATAERKVYDNQVLATLSSISEAIKGITPFKIAEKDSSSFLGKILTSFGLIGAGAVGLAAGLAAGWVVYVGALIKDIGKIVKALISAIPKPKWVDEIFDVLKNVGGNMFTKIKNFFVGEKGFVKRITAVVDGVIDALKGVTGGMFTKIKTFFVGETGFIKRITTVIDGVIDSLKGVTGGMFTKIKTFFVGEAGFIKRITAIIDPVIDTLKGFTGGIFTKIKNFFVGEASVFKRIGTIVDTAVEGVKGFTGGLFTKITNFFTGEASIFKRIGKIADTTIESLKLFTGGAFNKIAAPFKWLRTNTTTGSIIGDALDAIMGIFKTGAGEGGFMTKLFNGIKSVFSSLKSIGSTLMAPFTAIKDVFGAVSPKGTGGIMKTIMGFINPFKGVFTTFARIGARLAAPLSIIMGIFDAGFEAKDAVEKSEGLFASLLNGLIGAIGGFIDGAVLQVADFLKDGIATVLGFFGFEETEKAMKDISFSKSFNEMLDQIYAFVNDLFNIDVAKIGRTILGDKIYDFLFGDDKAGAKVSDLYGYTDVGAKEIDVTKMEEAMKTMSEDQMKAYASQLAVLRADKGLENEEAVNKVLSKMMGATVKLNTGGLVKSTGLATVHEGELMLDNQAATIFKKGVEVLTGSQALEQAGRGGAPVVVNNINNSQSNPVISNQSTTMKVPDSVRSADPTFALARQSFSY